MAPTHDNIIPDSGTAARKPIALVSCWALDLPHSIPYFNVTKRRQQLKKKKDCFLSVALQLLWAEEDELFLMRSITVSALRVASAIAVLGLLVPTAFGHGDDNEAMGMEMGMDMSSGMTSGGNATQPEAHFPPSYFAHPEHRGILLGHIGLMVLGWVFLLPLGKSLVI